MHRLARNDARRLHVDAALLVELDRALAVDRVAERIDHAAEQALADRHLDDGAGALDDVAFLDVAVVAEDHDADIVDFEVQRHAARAVGELDHLAGLHLVEAIDAGDAVADRQHLADLGDLGFLAEILDLLLEDRGDLSGPDIHQPTSFMATLSELNLVRSEVSIMRLPTLTTRPPSREGSTRSSSMTSLPSAACSACFSAVTWASVSFDAAVTDGARLAALAGEHGAEGADHVGDREQAAVLGDKQEEIPGQTLDLELLQDGGERAALLLGGEDRALDEPRQVLDGVERFVETGEIDVDLLERVALKGKLEQSGRIAARNAGTGLYLSCHLKRLPPERALFEPPRPRTREMMGLALPRQQVESPEARPSEAPRSL